MLSMYSLLGLLKVQLMFMEWSLVTFPPVPLFTANGFAKPWSRTMSNIQAMLQC